MTFLSRQLQRTWSSLPARIVEMYGGVGERLDVSGGIRVATFLVVMRLVRMALSGLSRQGSWVAF